MDEQRQIASVIRCLDGVFLEKNAGQEKGLNIQPVWGHARTKNARLSASDLVTRGQFHRSRRGEARRSEAKRGVKFVKVCCWPRGP